MRLLCLSLLLFTSSAHAITTVDQCNPVCPKHHLQSRMNDTLPWVDVSPDPVRALGTTFGGPGVEWTDITQVPGQQFRTASRYEHHFNPYIFQPSPWSDPLVVSEPPRTPLIFSGLGAIALLYGWRHYRK